MVAGGTKDAREVEHEAVRLDTDNATDWLAPAPTEKLADGMAVTPAGIPCKEMLTIPENPFSGLIETRTAGVVLPTTTDAEAGETVSVKSSTGGGGPC